MKDHIFKTEYCDHGINPEIKYRTKSIDQPDNIEYIPERFTNGRFLKINKCKFILNLIKPPDLISILILM